LGFKVVFRKKYNLMKSNIGSASWGGCSFESIISREQEQRSPTCTCTSERKSMAENNRNSAMKENKVASIQVTEGGHREQGIHKLVRTDQRK
jgi:hypothetical protein